MYMSNKGYNISFLAGLIMGSLAGVCMALFLIPEEDEILRTTSDGTKECYSGR